MDDDVVIESENSAWDALRDRFESAAQQGGFIDLTDESSSTGQTLSASEATESFNELPVPVAAQTMVGASTPVAMDLTNSTETPDALKPIKDAIHDVLDKLKAAREQLLGAMRTGEEVLAKEIKAINRSVTVLQKKVNSFAEELQGAPRLMHQIEELNKVVMKANILIQQYNKQNNDEDSAAPHMNFQDNLSWEGNSSIRRESRSERYKCRNSGAVAVAGVGRSMRNSGGGAGAGVGARTKRGKVAKTDLVELAEHEFLWEGDDTSEEEDFTAPAKKQKRKRGS